MKSRILWMPLLWVAITSQAQIHVDFDQNVNFEKFKTFRFEPGIVIRQLGVKDTNAVFANEYVKDAITKTLVAKGLTPSNQNADLVITFLAGAREKTQIQNYTNNYGYYPYTPFYRYGMASWWGPGWNNFWVRNYEEGTVIFDVYDAHKPELVWRAYAVASINNFNEKKFVEREIARSFKHFPPKKS